MSFSPAKKVLFTTLRYFNLKNHNLIKKIFLKIFHAHLGTIEICIFEGAPRVSPC